MSNIVKGSVVKFIEYQKNSKWEKNFGLEVGDTVEVVDIDGESLWVLSKTGNYVCIHISRVVKRCKNDKNKSEPKLYNPLVTQEGGGHYKDKGIQPIQYTMLNKLSFCEGNVVKYISRYKNKNGIEDLAKVVHYALLAAYEEYGEEGSTELKSKVLKLLGVGG